LILDLSWRLTYNGIEGAHPLPGVKGDAIEAFGISGG